MLLSGALFTLFLLGFWLYCLTDAILTPAAECRGLSKPAWIAVISVTFIFGAIAWLVARRPVRNSYPQFTPLPEWDPDAREDDSSFLSLRWTDSDNAVARHPAGRARLSDAERPRAGRRPRAWRTRPRHPRRLEHAHARQHILTRCPWPRG